MEEQHSICCAAGRDFPARGAATELTDPPDTEAAKGGDTRILRTSKPGKPIKRDSFQKRLLRRIDMRMLPLVAALNIISHIDR